MSIKKYEAFVRTAELGSLTKAAAELGSTQSRISHVLADLEEEYGFTLMIRRRSGVRLTAAGEMLLPRMQELLRQEALLQELVGDIRGADSGTIRIGAFTSVAVHWLPGMIQAFQTAHPNVEFQMFNGDYHDVSQWLQDGEVDLGFVTLPAQENVRVIPLAQDELVAILPPTHRLAALERVPVQELSREPFISLLESSDHDIRRALAQGGVQPNAKFTTKDDYALIAMVEQGLGVSIVPELLIRGRHEGLAVRPLEPQASRSIALALPENRVQIPAVEAFAQSVVEWLREHG